jgi:hypothetical protein
MIEVMVSSGTDNNRKKGLVAALVEKLGEAEIAPNDIMVFFLETDRATGSFGGGRFERSCCQSCGQHSGRQLSSSDGNEICTGNSRDSRYFDTSGQGPPISRESSITQGTAVKSHF